MVCFCVSDESRSFCNVTQHPSLEARGRDRSLFSDTTLEVVKNMTVPITVLHVTSMSAPRSDAHVGNWSDSPSTPDCSHWCLPGVPDVWNEIVLSYLLTDYGFISDGWVSRLSSNYFLNFFFSLLACIQAWCKSHPYQLHMLKRNSTPKKIIKIVWVGRNLLQFTVLLWSLVPSFNEGIIGPSFPHGKKKKKLNSHSQGLHLVVTSFPYGMRWDPLASPLLLLLGTHVNC